MGCLGDADVSTIASFDCSEHTDQVLKTDIGYMLDVKYKPICFDHNTVIALAKKILPDKSSQDGGGRKS